ncbi:MAG: hypothetical protein AABX17_01970 [Nanoarchaeota archaeon]
MNLQRLLVVEDREYCPDGEGELIDKYLQCVFNRISQQVTRFEQEDFNWLIINSDSLTRVMTSSRSFFVDRFSKSLKEVGIEKKISPLCVVYYGKDGKRILTEYIEKRVCEKFPTLFYLTKERPSDPFVVYQFSKP